MPRILAIDFGKKRLGIAVSDELNMTAQGVCVVERKDDTTYLKEIKSLVTQYNISKIIIGMPLNMNGTKGPSSGLVEDFTESLKKELAIPIEFVDERLSTLQGERVLLEADVSRRKRKLSIDKIAAQIILQTYLETNV
ncbi:MAG: Holliday junction resolvase RuvX [Candidatus Omnitrophota bacterium]